MDAIGRWIIEFLRAEFVDPLGRFNLLVVCLYLPVVYWADNRMSKDLENLKLFFNFQPSQNEMVEILAHREVLTVGYVVGFILIFLVSATLLIFGPRPPRSSAE